MNTEKRIYSLSLIAYVIYATKINPEYYLDTESNTTYAQFPECDEVANAIKQFRNNTAVVNLAQYNNTARAVKAEFKKKTTSPTEQLRELFK